MKLKIERRQLGAVGTGDSKVISQNTLASRTLNALPGERLFRIVFAAKRRSSSAPPFLFCFFSANFARSLSSNA